MAKILTVDDERGIREFLADVLTGEGHEVAQAENAKAAIARLENEPFDLLLVDLRMPGELGGMDVVRRARAEFPEMQVIVLTAHGSVQIAVEAMRLGAFDFLQKPVAGPDELRALVTRALNWRGGRVRSFADAQERLGRALWQAEEPRSWLKNFLWQLKRRHVYNVGATYAAVTFIVLQSAELLIPAVPGAPTWMYGALVGVMLAGLPVALVLGWVYDITASGLKRTT
jgi:DNA-binding response OmpR family regulator